LISNLIHKFDDTYLGHIQGAPPRCQLDYYEGPFGLSKTYPGLT